MELLACVAEATKEEAQAQTEKKVREDAAEEGGLDDRNQVSLVAILFVVLRNGVLYDEYRDEDDLDD